MKWIKKITLFTLLSVFLLLGSLYVFNAAFLPKDNKICLYCTNTSEALNLQSHTIPIEISSVYKKVIQYYPDLEDENIEISFESISSTMLSQPVISWSNIFREKRKYIIKINNDFESNKTLDYRTMSEEILIGWLGHELSHIVDYKDRNFLSIIGIGFNYVVSKSFKSEVENFADKNTIYRGLGDELLLGVEYSTGSADISSAYKAKLVNDYYSAEELKAIISDYKNSCTKRINNDAEIIDCNIFK